MQHRQQINTVQRILQETFLQFDELGIFIAANNNKQEKEKEQHIDVLLPSNEMDTFHNEELVVTDLDIKLPFSSFDKLWNECITILNKSTTTTSNNILFNNIRSFFSKCRLHRDPRCLRFRESVRLERIFERKLFEEDFALFEMLLSKNSSNCFVDARLAEAWLTVVDYYFFYFKEFRFPVPDGQAAEYSSTILQPMNLTFLYTRIRRQAAGLPIVDPSLLQAQSHRVAATKVATSGGGTKKKTNKNSKNESSSSSLLFNPSSICDKDSFLAHLELIASNCILYNGSKSYIASRAEELLDTSSLREATNHISKRLQKAGASSTKSRTTTIDDVKGGEDFSVRWFNEVLNAGGFVAPVVEDKKNKKQTKTTEKKTTAVAVPKKTIGKRRQREEEESSSSDDDDETTTSSDDEDETTTTSSSFSDDDENDVPLKASKTTRATTNKKKKNPAAAVQQQSTKSTTVKSTKNTAILSSVNLEEVHSTLFFIWDSVQDKHLPKSQQLINQIEAKKNNSSENVGNNTTNVSPSIRREQSTATANGGTALSMMRNGFSVGGGGVSFSQQRNGNNIQNSFFSKEVVEELSALKMKYEMVESELKKMGQ